MINNKIKLDCDYIISNNLTWKESKLLFNIQDPNLERVYVRYIIVEYGLKKAKFVLREK